MRSGALRHRITIEELTNAQDTLGGEAGTWSDFAANIPASYEPLTGKEFVAAEQENAQAQARFRIRYLAGVSPAMRINFGGRLFKITAPPIDPRGGNRELQLMAVEIT